MRAYGYAQVFRAYGDFGSNNDCSFHNAFPMNRAQSNHGPWDGKRCTNWHQNMHFVWSIVRKVCGAAAAPPCSRLTPTPHHPTLQLLSHSSFRRPPNRCGTGRQPRRGPRHRLLPLRHPRARRQQAHSRARARRLAAWQAPSTPRLTSAPPPSTRSPPSTRPSPPGTASVPSRLHRPAHLSAIHETIAPGGRQASRHGAGRRSPMRLAGRRAQGVQRPPGQRRRAARPPRLYLPPRLFASP